LSEENEIEEFIVSKTVKISDEEINKLSKLTPIFPRHKEKAMIEFIEGKMGEILKSE
jgi:hypothetical protein